VKHIVIVHTGGGVRYANRIFRSVRWIENRRRLHITTHLVPPHGGEIERLLDSLPREDTIIHARAAHPDARFMDVLDIAHEEGWKIVNKPSVLRLTSNKGLCATTLLREHLPHPKTWVLNRERLSPEIVNELDIDGEADDLIVKPVVSNGQGKFVKKIPFQAFYDGSWVNLVSGSPVVVQEVVPYSAIYRVICIDGHALPYAFVDKQTFHPAEWKVSVCLNKLQHFVPNPGPVLLALAERVQQLIGGEINFIDIFETGPGHYVISEINTACSLFIHERLATAAGHIDANIHNRIARYLIDQLYMED